MPVLTCIGASIAGLVVGILWFLVLLLMLAAAVYVLGKVIDVFSWPGAGAERDHTAGR